MRQAIPLATSLGTLLGMYLAGSKRWEGWAVGLANQALWLWFIVQFEAWGLLPLLVALVFVYTRNLLLWRAETPTPAPGDVKAECGLCGAILVLSGPPEIAAAWLRGHGCDTDPEKI